MGASGKVTCPSCGATNYVTDDVCLTCSASLTESPEAPSGDAPVARVTEKELGAISMGVSVLKGIARSPRDPESAMDRPMVRRVDGSRDWLTLDDVVGVHVRPLGPHEKRAVFVGGKKVGRVYDDITALIAGQIPDGWRVAYVGHEGDTQFAVIDGQPGLPYDDIEGLQFSPTGEHVAYLGLTTRGVTAKCVAVLDRWIGPEYSEIRGLTFMPDGERLAFAARHEGHWHIVIGFEEGREWESVIDGPVISEDGEHVAWAIRRAKVESVVLDGNVGPEYGAICSRLQIRSSAEEDQPGGLGITAPTSAMLSGVTVGLLRALKRYGRPEAAKAFDEVLRSTETPKRLPARYSSLTLSSDGSRLAYVAVRGGKQVVVVDGVEEREYDEIAVLPEFDPLGCQLLYVGRTGDMQCVVVNGEEGPWCHGVRSLACSIDGRHAGYAARRGDQWCVVVDGEAGPPFDEVEEFRFVENYSLYTARHRGRTAVVIDGEQGPWCAEVTDLQMTPGPEGLRTAYGARLDGRRWTIVVDGQRDPRYDCDQVRGVAFTSDGTELICAVQRGRRCRLLVNGDPREEYDCDQIMGIASCPDTGRLACAMKRGDTCFAVVGSERGPTYDGILEGTLAFSGAGELEYLALRGSTVYHVHHPVPGGTVSIEPLRARLCDPDQTVRREAVKALVEIGGGEVVDALIECLEDRDEFVRLTAARALGEIGDSRAAEPLRARQSDVSELVHREANAALEAVAERELDGTQPPSQPEQGPAPAVTAARKLLSSGQPREAAQHLTGWLQGEPQDLVAWQLLREAYVACGAAEYARRAERRIAQLRGGATPRD